MKYTKNLRIDGNKVISYSTHVATIDHSTRKLTVHGHWSQTTSKHINYVSRMYHLNKIEGDAPKSADEGLFASVAMVAKLASVFASETPKASNDWKLRMMKAGLANRGLTVPENWDQLTEAEKTKRLDGALAAIAL